jgi:hypothetical protein
MEGDIRELLRSAADEPYGPLEHLVIRHRARHIRRRRAALNLAMALGALLPVAAVASAVSTGNMVVLSPGAAHSPLPSSDASAGTGQTDNAVRGLDGTGGHDRAASNEVEVPPRPGASAERLGDGSPVWVVRHEDGAVSVLAADVPSVDPRWPQGVREQLLWVSESRIFVPARSVRAAGTYDERGQADGGLTRPDVDSYDYEWLNDTTVLVGQRRQAQIRQLAAPEDLEFPWSYMTIYAGAVSPHPSGDRKMEPEEAAAEPRGKLVYISGTLVGDGSGPARICKRPAARPVHEMSACPRQAPAALDVVGAPMEGRATWYLNGPFLARVASGGFTGLIKVGNTGTF